MKSVLTFLTELQSNNERDWFNANKDRFQEVESDFKQLIRDVEEGLIVSDLLDTSSTKVFRIYRDVRFSRDKTPFHVHRSASFKRATAERRGGYYLRVENGNSRIVGGFFNPNSADLLHIRKQIQQEPEALTEIFDRPSYQQYFNGLEGECVKTTPKGFNKEDPAIDLLRHKQFLVYKYFNDDEVRSANFAEMVIEGFVKMRPFFDFMSTILTTDLNGNSLLD